MIFSQDLDRTLAVQGAPCTWHLSAQPRLSPATPSWQSRLSIWQFGNDPVAFRGSHLAPLRDLFARAVTAEADPGIRMYEAHLDAGALDVVAFPEVVAHVAPMLQIRSSAPCRMKEAAT